MKESYFKNKDLYYKVNDFVQNRTTLIFIHGLSGSSSAWLSYEKVLENKYNILTYDIRGHGLSKKYPNYSDYEIKNFVEDLHELVLYLKISKFILVSHSFGSLIALEYIESHKENISLNILLAPVSDLNKDFSTKLLSVILKFSKIYNMIPFNSKSGHQVDYTKHVNSGDWNIKRCYADVSNTTLRIYLYCLRQSLFLPKEDLLERIKVPTLIVHGLKDTMVSAKNSIIMSQKIEKSELLLLPEANHIVVLNNVKEVLGALEYFIKKHKTIFS